MIDNNDQNLKAKLLTNDFETIYELFISGQISLPLLVTLMKERTSLSEN
ncbi:MAG: hypothetical protein HRT47_08635 [Candidatus Caenarcaniphilales bacterium]|nr:hypothetical protein [Candidatus Caenarcaniphilales bacterium]